MELILVGLAIILVGTVIYRGLRAKLTSYQAQITDLNTAIVERNTQLGAFQTLLTDERVKRAQFEQDAKRIPILETERDAERKRAEQFSEKNATLHAKIAEQDSSLREREQIADRLSSELEKFTLLSESTFRSVADSILTKTGSSLIEKSGSVVDPLKRELEVFRQTVEAAKTEGARDLTSLKKDIQELEKLNLQLSKDAQDLASALKSDVKIQGTWGEDRLNLILEAEGLQQYVDYTKQLSYVYTDIENETESKKRPDLILNLPGNKCLVIDSKVTLASYIAYFNTVEPLEKSTHLKTLTENINKHIDRLSKQNYQTLLGLPSTPDFVIMFIPVEAALTLALNQDPTLFDQAQKKKIVIATPMTLISMIKIIKLLWANDDRLNNVEEIYTQFGRLYDKFAGFMTAFKEVGDSLHKAGNSYDLAFDRLEAGKRRGDTIIGRFEKIKQLGAKAKQALPPELLTDVNFNDEEIEEETMEEVLPELIQKSEIVVNADKPLQLTLEAKA